MVILQRGFIVLAKTTEFLTNVKGELKKVTWPTRKDTIASTTVVIVLVFVVAVFLWVVDSALSAVIRALLS
ncbi:MAG: preprotein translocase subunit SecE [Desulfuromonadales bacterium]|uniref:preprotein translocase subunit SecE n=1 Tax=Desulfuromonas sp. KJ2020 TaxID=2919173 RepID=UPI003532107A